MFIGRETPQYVPNRFQPVDFHTDNLNAILLDFFTYNPVDDNYPRLGVTSLNTKNKEVIAAILQSGLEKGCNRQADRGSGRVGRLLWSSGHYSA
jgi:hypothetical protein